MYSVEPLPCSHGFNIHKLYNYPTLSSTPLLMIPRFVVTSTSITPI